MIRFVIAEATYKDEYRYEDSYDARGFDIQDGCFAIRCKNATRLDMSAEIASHLRNAQYRHIFFVWFDCFTVYYTSYCTFDLDVYRIDPDLAPVSSECSEVQILVENEIVSFSLLADFLPLCCRIIVSCICLVRLVTSPSFTDCRTSQLSRDWGNSLVGPSSNKRPNPNGT